MIFQIVYRSIATNGMSRAGLIRLLSTARKHNASVGITGMLLFHDGKFLQVLEGDEGAVRKLFAKIALDKRHAEVQCVLERNVDVPGFADWTMGLFDGDAQILAGLPGLNTVLVDSNGAQEQTDAVLALLDMFRDGETGAASA